MQVEEKRMNNWEMIWNGASVHSTMHELMDRTRKCEGIAMDVCGDSLSFQGFHERSDVLAAWLQAQGYGKDDIIILSMDVSPDLYCMIAAVMKSGATVTVTEAEITKMRLDKLYAQTHAKARITDDMIPRIYEEGKSYQLKSVTDQVRPGDVYAIWYTSGSTGEPCGILTTSYNTVCNIIPEPGNEIMSTCLKESRALINISHPSFGVGFTNFFYALFYGIKFVHVLPGQGDSIRNITAKIKENQGSFLLVPPSGVTALMQDDKARESFQYCNAVMMGADTVKQSLIGEVQETLGSRGKVINLYGISDVGLVAAKIARKDDPPHAIGRPTACTQFLVVDEERRPLPAGEKGELCITGLRVGPGYLQPPDSKKDKFVHDEEGRGFFYTGDYGYLGQDGEVFLLGRIDRRIKHLGYRIDPIEIEEVIRKEAKVRNVAVKQFENETGQVLCAFYEHPAALDPDMLRTMVSSVLPRYCVPERFVNMEKLPLTKRGKLDYKALTLEDGNRKEKEYEAPETPIEKVLCDAFESVLGCGVKVSRHDSFFELGGDSVSGMLLLSYLSEKEDIHCTIEDLFTHPKPLELAPVAGEKRGGAPSSVAEPTLPDYPEEISSLKESGEIEEILPADAAERLYLFLEESKSEYQRGLTHRVRVRLERIYTEEAFRNRIQNITGRHPVLRSSFIRDHSGKRWQVFYHRKDIPIWFRDLCALSGEARERYLAGFFQVMDEKDAPIQAACFPISKKSCELLLRLKHTHADGMSAMILVNEIADDHEPERADSFYDYRKRKLANAGHFPEELTEYYSSFSGNMRLPLEYPGGIVGVAHREILLTKEQTGNLKKRCSLMAISLPGYVEYAYGKGLLAAADRKDIWFSHLYSGRDGLAEPSGSMIGNLFYTMPVHIQKDMSCDSFQKGLLKPWKYPYLSDTQKYRDLNRHNTEEGIVSRIFMPPHKNVESIVSMEEDKSTGHYMEMADDQLRIVFRYPGDPLMEHAYGIIETVMRDLLLNGQDD